MENDADSDLPDWGWLTARQSHVAYTLAHANAHIGSVDAVLFDYLAVGPFVLTNQLEGQQALVVVTDVRPLPEAVPRYFADALTQLRAALEHVLFIEIESAVGRQLTEGEARSVEIPAATTLAAFEAWSGMRTRKRLFASSAGQEILRRVRILQPFWHAQPGEHPLRVLVDHTNRAKHRAPSIAATLLGGVMPDESGPGLSVEAGEERPVLPGQVLARGPASLRVELSVWPKVSVQRRDGQWRVIMHELNDLATWVRLLAVPTLVAGASSFDPLPPGIDLAVGHRSVELALDSAGLESAFELGSARVQAVSTRPALASLLAQHDASLPIADAESWVGALSDSKVVDTIRSLGTTRLTVHDMPRVFPLLDALVAEARRSSRS